MCDNFPLADQLKVENWRAEYKMIKKQDARTACLERAQKRRLRIVAHRAANFEDAERWDLAYWQSQTPQERLSALVAIRADVEKAEQARREYEQRA